MPDANTAPNETPMALKYDVAGETYSRHCALHVSGTITLANGCELLTHLWQNAVYADSESAMWDVSNCELPEFNELVRTAEFIKREKARRGPDVVAFVSPAFASSALARAFRGFDRLMSLDVNFFGNAEHARKWIDKRVTARATP